jgi:5-formyltetrahydrofolate cyclo-ligase
MTGNSELKSALRASHRQRRIGCDPHDPGFAQRLTALPEWHEASTVAGYLGYGSEPRVTHALQAAISLGKQVLLPQLQSDGDLTWVAWDGNQESLSRVGNVMEPIGSGEFDTIADADLIITPALAVDRAGHRLGQGGGSFDRALARATEAISIALIYDHDLVDQLPVESHDRVVSIAVTPTQTIRFRESR